MMTERKRKANVKLAKKFFPKHSNTIDSVRDGQSEYNQGDTMCCKMHLVHGTHWRSCALRKKRHERYVFGDQWGDKIERKDKPDDDRKEQT